MCNCVTDHVAQVMGSRFRSWRTKKSASDWPFWNNDFVSWIRIRDHFLASFNFQDAGRCFEWKCWRYEDYG